MLRNDNKTPTRLLASPDTSTRNISSSTTSPLRAHNQSGIEKFLTTQRKKQIAYEIDIVSNKINLLIKLEQKAHKHIDKAKKQAEEIQKAKIRNESKSRAKGEVREIKTKEIEEMRKKNIEEKKKRVINIKNMQESILREKKEYAKKVKNDKAEIDEINKSFRDMIQKQKTERRCKRVHEVNQHKIQSQSFASKMTQQLKKAYEEKIAIEKESYLELMRQKSLLEKREAEIAEKYTKIVEDEVQAFKQLEEIAKIKMNPLAYKV